MTDSRPGLFAPRAGQHYRDEQRRRKSKYDRGTRLAEMEENEYEYEGAFEHYQSPYPVYPQTPAGYPMTCKFQHDQHPKMAER